MMNSMAVCYFVHPSIIPVRSECVVSVCYSQSVGLWLLC